MDGDPLVNVSLSICFSLSRYRYGIFRHQIYKLNLLAMYESPAHHNYKHATFGRSRNKGFLGTIITVYKDCMSLIYAQLVIPFLEPLDN